MKLKLLTIIAVFLILISSINVIALNNYEKKIEICSKNEVLHFNSLKINTKEEFIELDIDSANSKINIPKKPTLPIDIKTYTFPIGTKINSVDVNPYEIIELKINKKIKPASNPQPRTKINFEKNDEKFDSLIYNSKNLYPKNEYDYKISSGIINGKDVLILNIYLYPIRYKVLENKLYHTKKFDIKISYEKPIITKETNDLYDMVIICPNKFKKELDSFVSHKNNYGIKTKIKTTSSIYADSLLKKYDDIGRDKAEKVKYFIKWAKEEWGVEYVLLLGGRVGQLLKWHVPVRYTNLVDDLEKRHLSDLYFSDLYKYNETTHSQEFEDWDSNKNNIFAELDTYEDISYADKIDFYPDIKVGRLAVRNKKELRTVLDKIISYEKNTNGSDWFKNFTTVGGDTSPPVRDGEYGYNEGDIETRLSASYLKPLGFNINEVFISTGNFTNTIDLVNAISNGSGFIHLSGHGNPMTWTNFPPDSTDEEDTIDYMFTNFEMKLLSNKEKLPICVIGACHSSQFDVCILNILKGIFTQGLFKYFFGKYGPDSGGFKTGEWVRRCWSWNMVVQKNGGSIATIGNTGLGYGDTELNCTERYDGFITTRFFYNYMNQSKKGIFNLGDIHSKTISDYILLQNVADYQDWVDIKTIEGWSLLGDPSLRIGGYPDN